AGMKGGMQCVASFLPFASCSAAARKQGGDGGYGWRRWRHTRAATAVHHGGNGSAQCHGGGSRARSSGARASRERRQAGRGWRRLFCCFVLLLSLVHLCFGDSIPVCKDNEKAALLQFKRSLRDPSNRLSSWTAGIDCCGWSGVGCSNRTGHVVRLALRTPLASNASSNARTGDVDSRLGGEIGPSLLGLRHLA
ncbi:hypothetical protein Taro_008756, partial [Colocasia esculenta]|nr:hypothetical protein [Colocasia esculenta]